MVRRFLSWLYRKLFPYELDVNLIEAPPGMEYAALERPSGGEQRIVIYHALSHCTGRPCPIHFRSKHRMRAWPQNWRDDAGFMERICPHGVGYPDPDCRQGVGRRYGTCGHNECLSGPQRAFQRMVG